jgi:hypothetical protein
MNGNERTLKTYLYENRVSPTPEFSARIDGYANRSGGAKRP